MGGYAGGYGARRDFAVVRYNANGSRDLTFSDDGKQLTTVGVYDDMAQAVAIQADGKILLTGCTQLTNSPSGPYAIATVRYTGNGSLDATFNGRGITTTSVGIAAEASFILVQSDAKIVIAGNTKTGTVQDIILLRYNSNGSLDASFGNGGTQLTDFNNGADRASTALFTDGRILVTGWTDPTGNRLREMAFARYTATGQPDVGFSGDGEVTQYISTGSTGYIGVAVQPDKKVLAVGGTVSNDFYEDVERIALARYNPDGTFDTSFGSGGKVAITLPTKVGSFGASADAFALLPDGKILVGSNFYNQEAVDDGVYTPSEDFLLVRYTADGAIDHSFANNGLAFIDFGDEVGTDVSTDYLTSIAIQPDGKIVAAGIVERSEDFIIVVARCNADGSLDASFGGNGKQTIQLNNTYFEGSHVEVVIQPDGKLIIAGAPRLESTGQQVFGLVRLHTNGTLDPSFSRDGQLTTSFGNFLTPVGVSAVTIQPDGKIIAAGISNGNFTLVRYFANGNLDLSFSGDGKQTTNFGGNDAVSSIVLQPDGKILAAGVGNNRFALARYQPNGTLDSSFGVTGKQTNDIEPGRDSTLR